MPCPTRSLPFVRFDRTLWCLDQLCVSEEVFGAAPILKYSKRMRPFQHFVVLSVSNAASMVVAASSVGPSCGFVADVIFTGGAWIECLTVWSPWMEPLRADLSS